MADVEDLKSSGNNTVWVQVPYPAPKNHIFPLSLLILKRFSVLA